MFIILILVVFGQVSLKISYKNIPLVLCASMLFIFSLSNVITFGDFALLTLPKDGYYAKIGETFRATGRYLWLTYYLLMLFVFWFMNQKINNKFILNILFVFLFLIQYHDVKPLFTSKVTYVDGAGDAVDEGKLINTRGMEKVFISPFYGAENFIEWSLVGYMNRAATTEVYLARYNNEIVSKHVSVLLGNLSNSHILEKEVIVFPKDKGCEYIDFTKLSVTEDTEYYYLKTNNKRKIHEVKYKAFTIEEYLRHRKDKLIILSVKDEGSSSMSLGLRKYLTETNNKLGELDFRQSGLAVVCSDSLYFNQVADSELSYQGVIEGVELFVTSGGKLSSNKSSIIVGGVEYSFNQRGVNIVVIDINTKKVERRLFLDTYSGENLYIIDKVVDE